MTTTPDAGFLMRDFADRTGISNSERPPRRYLWTDAFAVCNFLGLYREHGDEGALRLALRLVEQVHAVLGRHRPDDVRRGWISGLADANGEDHPTRGGLRIGKSLPERGPDEPFDPNLEWERDGQYFHYLTRWMHALARVAHVTSDPRYHRWACELARAAYSGFVHSTASGAGRMFWKMSIDLRRPQVASSGQHDPLDGFVTYASLQAIEGASQEFDLSREINGYAELCVGRTWDTDDPLGIGGLLCDANRLAQLAAGGLLDETRLMEDILHASSRGLDALISQGAFRDAAERRLGFRELGLSIGLHAAERIRRIEPSGGFRVTERCGALLEDFARYQALAARIERFWLEPAHRSGRSWCDHRDINDVMLATSLAPRGYLELGG